MQRRKILFFTNSDYGQANVVLATVHALLGKMNDVEIHIASFHGLRANVGKITTKATDSTPNTAIENLFFHGMDGVSHFEAVFRPEVGVREAYDLKPSLVNSARNILSLPGMLMPWTPEEFQKLYSEASAIFEHVRPDLTVVDPVFSAGLTLCHHLRVHWIVLAPNTIKEFAVPLQPRLAMFWKYPMLSSGFPYPIPLHLIPQNAALTLVAGYMLLTEKRISQASKRLQSVDQTLELITANELGVMKAPPPGLRVLVSSSSDLDYPFAIIPHHIVPCGPIIRPAPALQSVDPALGYWLKRGPTVYVNLGTHLQVDINEAMEMAYAFRELLDQSKATRATDDPELQILWKLQRKLSENEEASKTEFSGRWKDLLQVLSPELKNDRIRITDWVTAEPLSVLMSGAIVCSVSHGGANSFNESLCAGVPQVLLPAWVDCYDFGNRVELLNIGRWSNKKAKPRWERTELADGLIEVLLSKESSGYSIRAKRLALQHPENAGRENAADQILQALDNPMRNKET